MSERDLFPWILCGWLLLAPLTLLLLLRVAAPYGRHARAGWGPTLHATWGWILMEAPAPSLFLVLYLLAGAPADPVSLVFLGMWLLHYVNRAFVFPLRRSGAGKPMPLAIAGSGFFFNLTNAYLQASALFRVSDPYPAAWLTDPRFLAGVALFGLGFAVNLHSDAVLRNLRRPGDTGYRIPRGGVHRWVSCGNFFGEILEWVGWAIATWSLAGLAFAAWTAANLIPRALAHHRWYRETFADYPPERKAVLPFVL